MGLGIYTSDNSDSRASDNDFDDIYRPFTVTVDGRIGGTGVYKLFLRNNDSAVSYSGITITPVDSGVPSRATGAFEGFSWKLIEGDRRPTSEEWTTTSAGVSIDMPNLGNSTLSDTATYLPFWTRVQVPANQSVATITSVSLVVEGTEIAI